MINGKEILITGGAGTLGKEITKMLLKEHSPRGIRIYSRDEEKHRLFKKELEEAGLCGNVSFLIGDIRDLTRLSRACNEVDIIIHTAAMKQIPHCEYNPIEAVRTNVDGTCNVIDAAINNLVEKVMLISTDKACYPVNLYGCTKASAEKLFLHANVYSPHYTKFSICRYGNVLGSRGSVVQIWKEQYEKTKKITLTDEKMTRFWITVNNVARFVLNNLEIMNGRETFIPKMKSLDMKTFADIVVPSDAEIVACGFRKGEKKHECLISEEESIYTEEKEFHYLIDYSKQSSFVPWMFTSENAERWTKEEILETLKKDGLR